jgi:hypothetical protein
MALECLAALTTAVPAAAARGASAGSWIALPSALHLLRGLCGCMLLICAVIAPANLLEASVVFE